MAETTHITVAETSDGPGGTPQTGTEVSLPVVELLTGRGFVTGKSGSGKSNSASVIAEKLLDNGFGLLIVDIDGEYYGLKEEYEILHVGGDEECDIQVTEDHSEKIASLALEQNVPIILDVSSYLDESEAETILTAVARSLFAKAKKQKQPFLLLVEEVHEYIPENGSVGECGKMLIKIGKRGRKHGLGVCGISQRPADVKKDFITQCDWLLWHRLTWNNDTKVVRRILDGEYADAVESLDDGEGFLMTDWSERVRRVQFYRKQTFDAGATPGLDDFERPELKSVSDDLVDELAEISEEEAERENRIAELREELDKKNSRIAELEAELQDARNLERMADQFVDALVDQVEGAAPGRTERERMRRDGEPGREMHAGNAFSETEPTAATGPGSNRHSATTETNGQTATAAEQNANGHSPADQAQKTISVDEAALDEAEQDEVFSAIEAIDETGGGDESETPATSSSQEDATESTTGATNESDGPTENDWPVTAQRPEEPDSSDDTDAEGEAASAAAVSEQAESHADETGEFSAAKIMSELRSVSEQATESVSEQRQAIKTPREQIESTIRNDAEIVDDDGPEPLAVRELKADIGSLETKTRKMLSFYREFGPSTPLNAHFAAGGNGNRTNAYAHNRALRTLGLIEHVGRGHYDYAVRDRLAADLDDHRDEETVDVYLKDIETTTDL
jgi:hypothetical protein